MENIFRIEKQQQKTPRIEVSEVLHHMQPSFSAPKGHSSKVCSKPNYTTPPLNPEIPSTKKQRN